MDDNKHITYLFHKYLDDSYTEEELNEILQFFELSEHDEFLAILIEQELDKNTTSELPEIKSIGESIAKSLFDKTNPTKVYQFRPLIPYVAAIALILLGTVLYYYNSHENISDKQIASDIKILPGGNRATIKIGSREILSLSDSKEGIINNGNSIIYNDGSTVEQIGGSELITLTTPRAGQYSVVLSDGTKVWLNAMSELVYPSQFDDYERNVWIKGEAYFEVTHDKKRPFNVHSDKQKISVLGTRFNIHAYTDDKTHHTTLVDGSVKIQSKIDQSSVILKPGYQAENNDNGSLSVRKVESNEFVAWKDGLIFLNGYDLGEIFTQLERWYDVDFVNVPSSLQSERLFGMIRRDVPLRDVLETIKDNFKSINYEIHGRRVFMSIK